MEKNLQLFNDMPRLKRCFIPTIALQVIEIEATVQ